MKLCVSQACTLPAAFADDVCGYADGGCTAIEIWLTKLEQHLEQHDEGETLRLLADRGVTPAAAAYQGGLLLSEGAARQAAFDLFRRRLDLCQRFAIPTLVLVADHAPKADVADLAHAATSLAEAARWAAGFGVKLALEFRGTDAVCTCLDTALLLVESCGEGNVGVCLDAFHYYKGPSKPEDLDRLTNANLAHVHLCDVPGVPREVMTDADRVFPGEGDFHLDPIVATLRRIGYAGYVSVEILNPVVGASKPSQVAELALTALQRVLERA